MKNQILIIESDIIELRKLREIFSKEGFNIMTATDLNTAKDIIEKIEVKYIISESSIFNCFKSNKSNKNPQEEK